MKSFYTACALCGAVDAEPLFPSFFRTQASAAQMIVICRHCGLVYRNPHIPDICADHYEDVGSWEGEHIYIERLRGVAERIRAHVDIAPGDLTLEIGCGPGWLAEQMHRSFPQARSVLLEPSPRVAAHAQGRNPHASVVPALLRETDLPYERFACVVACGVDYLFQHHKKDVERIHALLQDGGVLYIERNVFVDQKALTKRPVFDVEDLFGLNHRMNTWFGRAQFVEYFQDLFDVFDVVEYVSDVAGAPYNRENVVTGVFARKRRGGERHPPIVVNRYEEHLRMLSDMAVQSTLEDLRLLAGAGIRRVAICGTGREARLLATLVRQHAIFTIAGFGSLSDSGLFGERDQLMREFASGDPRDPIDAYLIASLSEQDRFEAELRAGGYTNVLRCFREGLPSVWNQSGKIQMKALLPAFLRAS